MDVDCELDVRGLNCPLPILRAKKTLAGMTSGQTLRVLATDPGARQDFPAFAEQSGNLLLARAESGGVFEFVLRRR
jgi:tRNA 2-thiouridine synthesizing protein A